MKQGNKEGERSKEVDTGTLAHEDEYRHKILSEDDRSLEILNLP